MSGGRDREEKETIWRKRSKMMGTETCPRKIRSQGRQWALTEYELVQIIDNLRSLIVSQRNNNQQSTQKKVKQVFIGLFLEETTKESLKL